ncbi:hypothetical protein BCR33DRAFT_462708 [Rhizoclosmatium globosum]|uniref:Uncharacterized protein n=1 Tax=Rhizoclosmatium globosum TaxID=329046 RepID=A0A1Y2BRN6_9FUNG|nr:hypothetical protein BCR33DRAFT_462708 [Rhizoclosmatium globosum]|eukprot:ORY37406.1 hypothetical protein BCR33DRAFT_462708 [Rhizoclosmatium globosum]
MLSTNESKPLFSFMAPQKDTPVVQTVAQLTENTVTGTDVKVVDVLTKEKGEEKAECPISDPVESKTLPEGLNDRTDKAATEAVSTPRPAFALPKKKQESWKKLMVPESPYVGGGVVSGGIVLPQLSLKQTGVSKVVPATIETKVEEAAVVSKIPVPRSSKKLGGVSSLSQVCQKEEDEGVVEVEEIVKAEKVADEELNAAVNAETLPLNENHQNVYEDEDPVVDLDDAVIHDISMMDESELDVWIQNLPTLKMLLQLLICPFPHLSQLLEMLLPLRSLWWARMMTMR